MDRKTTKWTPDAAGLEQPFRWRKPRHIIIDRDLFARGVPTEHIDTVLALVALTPQHTFEAVTEWPERLAEYYSRDDHNGYSTPKRVEYYMVGMPGCPAVFSVIWPLPNLWLGTTLRTQAEADARIPHLLACPAAVRFVVCDPREAVNFDFNSDVCHCGESTDDSWHDGHPAAPIVDSYLRHIDQVRVAGTTEPIHPDWVRGLRDQCVAAGTAFRFDGWGDWAVCPQREYFDSNNYVQYLPNISKSDPWRCGPLMRSRDDIEAGRESTMATVTMARVGHAKSGRTLDGRTWDQQPGQGGGE